MKITAVVLCYYPERKLNVKRIINDLKNSSRPPDKIIVFNNNADTTFDFDRDGVITINSNTNFWTRAKYIICLLEPSDYYLLIDDDITVGKNSISHFESLIPPDDPAFVTSSEGLLEDPRTYERGKFIREREINFPTQVTYFCGSIIFCSFASLLKMLHAEIEIRLKAKKYTYEGDDVLMGVANAPITIYPAQGDELCENLNEMGVNIGTRMFNNSSKKRYDFCINALEKLIWNKK